MNNIKTLIIDDEKYSRDTLTQLIAKYCPSLKIIGHSINPNEGKTMVEDLSPDLIFLDLQMPFLNGIDFLKLFPNPKFETIITTAYHEYAINAIKFTPMGYILKPIDHEELIEATQRVIKKLALKKESLPTFFNADKNIMILHDEIYKVIKPESILYIESIPEHRVNLYLESGQVYEVIRDLTEFEAPLLELGFFRCHRSYLIQITKIKEYVSDYNGGSAIMNNGKIVPIASRRKKDFMELFI